MGDRKDAVRRGERGRWQKRRGAFPSLTRLAAPLTLFSVVSVVLLGHGFWASDPYEQVPLPVEARDLPPELADLALMGTFGTTTGLGESPTRGVISPSFDGYAVRPGMVVTTPSRRIEVVYAKRGQTLTDIASQRGTAAIALMWANGITDPDRVLPVGLAVSVPPKGTMLHRVKESDTLESIARAYRVQMEEVTRYPANAVLQTGDLIPGAYLIIPTTNLPVRDRVLFYQLREGDSLARVATTYGLRDTRTLQWANSLPDVETVHPGQVIAVPPADGVIYVVGEEDTQRTLEDAVTQIAKNYACASVPCAAAPSDARVAELREATFAFGPNNLTRGGKLVRGRELLIPGGIPYVAPQPVAIPPNPTIENPVFPAPRPSDPPTVGVVAPAATPARAPVVGAASTRAPVAAPAPPPVRAPVPVAPVQGGGGRPNLIWPESGAITTRYSGAHNGIDIAAAHGTPLRAAGAGRVVSAGMTSYGLGNAVYIDHGDGFVTVYGHMANVNVSPGQFVSQGQMIGAEGNTGNSSGAHVHFTVIKNGRYVNPLEYLP